ncbi:MAG: AI-2E family transporter, partial [Bryobacteraceae bacterium]
MSLVSRQFNVATAAAPNRAFQVIALGVVIALLYWARVFLITFAVAVATAFILEPFVGLLMRIRFPRSLASFVVCSLALLVMYLIGLGAYTQAAGLMEDYQQNYGQRFAEVVQSLRTSIEETEKAIYQIVVPARQQQKQQQAEVSRQRRKKSSPPEPVLPPLPPPVQEVRILPERSPVAEYLYARLASVYQIALMASFVPFLVYFMLSWRDHAHRSFLQFFEPEDRVV